MRVPLPILLLFICGPVMAKADGGLTDRVGLGEASPQVLHHQWSLEAGLNLCLSRSSRSNNATYGLPSLLMRGGLGSFAEFRMALEYLVATQLDNYSHERGAPQHGLNFLSFGTKLALVNEGKALPQTGLIIMFGLEDTGSRHYELSESLFSFRLLSDKPLDEKITLSLNSGLSGTAAKGSWQGDNTLTFGYQATEKTEGFAEAWNLWYGDYQQMGVNLGIFIRPVACLKMELTGGVGYDGTQPQLFLNGGIALVSEQ
ncbi:hypothetical protein D770_09450 [Flammeovirgaceae bacterium 311]|nr:hypothetical protein D770_09450 [Flammeovirgaceae bacterium 311]